MKGSTSLLLLFLLPFVVFAGPLGDPPDPDIVLAGGPYSLLLPTKTGKFPADGKSDTAFGSFPKVFSKCGKHTVSENDLQTAFTSGSTLDLYVDCTPNPMVVIRGSSLKDKTTGAIDFKTPWGIQTCDRAPVDLNQVPWTNSRADVEPKNQDKMGDHSDFPDLCASFAQAPPSPAPAPTPKLLFANEDGAEISDYNYQRYSDAAGDQTAIPRWLGAKSQESGVFVTETPWSHVLKGKPQTLALQFTNAFVKLPKAEKPSPTGAEFKDCHATCDRGSIIKQTMNPGSWSMILYLKPDTDGFKICFDVPNHADDNAIPECKLKAEIHVLLKQGVVVWPNGAGTGRASMIQLRPPGVTTPTSSGVYAIEIGFGVKNSDGQMRGDFYVGNTYRQRVTSDTKGYDAEEASKLAFFFPNDQSLAFAGGISSDYIQNGKAYVTDAVRTSTPVMEKNPPVASKTGSAITIHGETSDIPTEGPKVPSPSSTTLAPILIGSNAAAGALLMSTDNANDAIYVAGKWWTWGIYIGFVVGTLVGIAIIGAIFYVLRRTVYRFWYRAMYKRYGCDASGTTGGITGAGFGQTTTGAITVANTGATGTTAGTTAGTTGDVGRFNAGMERRKQKKKPECTESSECLTEGERLYRFPPAGPKPSHEAVAPPKWKESLSCILPAPSAISHSTDKNSWIQFQSEHRRNLAEEMPGSTSREVVARLRCMYYDRNSQGTTPPTPLISSEFSVPPSDPIAPLTQMTETGILTRRTSSTSTASSGSSSENSSLDLGPLTPRSYQRLTVAQMTKNNIEETSRLSTLKASEGETRRNLVNLLETFGRATMDTAAMGRRIEYLEREMDKTSSAKKEMSAQVKVLKSEGIQKNYEKIRMVETDRYNADLRSDAITKAINDAYRSFEEQLFDVVTMCISVGGQQELWIQHQQQKQQQQEKVDDGASQLQELRNNQEEEDKERDKKAKKDKKKKKKEKSNEKDDEKKEKTEKEDEKGKKKEPQISVNPAELRFETATTSQKKLRLINKTTQTLMFQIKPSTTDAYLINPVFGKIEPYNFAEVMITHRPSAKRDEKLVIITSEFVGKELELAKTFKHIKAGGPDVTVKLVSY